MRISIQHVACWSIAGALIAGCSGGPGSAPVLVQPTSSLSQQSRVAPNAIQTFPPGALIEYRIPSHHSQTQFIAPAGDGNLWFTESALGKVGRITPAGVITEFSSVGGAVPNDIRIGPDKHAYFGSYGPDAICRIEYTGGIHCVNIPTSDAHPEQLVGDKVRNAIWFTETRTQAIGEFNIATQTFTEFPIPPPSGGSAVHPEAIALDRAGNIWFSDFVNDQVDEMSGGGTILQRVNLPELLGPSSLFPWRMTLGTNGSLWLVELTGGPESHGSVAKIDPTTGLVATYDSPSSNFGFAVPFDVVSVSDGVWITEDPVGIAHIGGGGHFREYSDRFSGATGITIGSDKNLWFVETGKNAIAKVDLSLFR